MRLPFQAWLGWATPAATVGVLTTLLTTGTSWAQAVPPRLPGDAAKAARQDARDAGRDVRGAAPQTRQEAREAGREARAEARVDLRSFNAATARAADLGLWFGRRPGVSGLVIADIAAQGAISKIGFREGDQIVSINGQPVATEADFTRLLLADNLRTQRVNVVVVRNGQQQTLVVQPSLLIQDVAAYDPWWQWGLVIDDRNPNQIVVQRVFPRTPAYYWGLRAGDVISGFGGQRIASVADLSLALQRADGMANLSILRNNQQRQLDIDLSTQARTALRPNLDTGGRIDGQNAPSARPDGAPTRPGLTPGATPATPAAPATPATPAVPGTTPAAPATPATPAVPAVPSASPTDPAAPVGTTPATPAVPATPTPVPPAGGTVPPR